MQQSRHTRDGSAVARSDVAAQSLKRCDPHILTRAFQAAGQQPTQIVISDGFGKRGEGGLSHVGVWVIQQSHTCCNLIATRNTPRPDSSLPDSCVDILKAFSKCLGHTRVGYVSNHCQSLNSSLSHIPIWMLRAGNDCSDRWLHSLANQAQSIDSRSANLARFIFQALADGHHSMHIAFLSNLCQHLNGRLAHTLVRVDQTRIKIVMCHHERHRKLLAPATHMVCKIIGHGEDVHSD
mmetsp:Transcript_30957/g.82215  ORF Transcript_30957/g.82215 Transcript_30957/m.82215 type:complete len:237 (-) Transcript_30957:205-915(-)